MFIYLRHGQSVGNEQGFLATSQTPLSAKGLEQAKAIAVQLKQYNIKSVLCSPYVRAIQTAQEVVIELNLKLEIKILEELHERILGNDEGKSKLFDSLYYYNSDNNATYEPTAKLFQRAQQFYKKIITEQFIGDVLIAGHSIFGLYLWNIIRGAKSLEELDLTSEMGNAKYFTF